MTRALIAGCALMIAGGIGCTTSPERERVDFERMRVQQRYDLYGASRAFPNGAMMQHPPAGTVSRETAATAEAGAPADSLASIPMAVTPQLLARGRERFGIYCAVCHGPGGYGGSIVASNMGIPRPPSLRSAALRARPIGYVFYVATNGRGRMPAYAPQLSPADRWAVAAYIQQMQTHGATTDEERADSARALEIHKLDSTAAAAGRP